MIEDPTLERIGEVRRIIYARCDNDPKKLVAYYMERQKQNHHRMLYASGDVQEAPQAPVEGGLSTAAVKTEPSV
jgi:hypothetical protein